MPQAIVQIDGNNFYASCEQMIDPSIKGKGLVILSNNDGCIIARSAEARILGIPMGQPYFKIKKKLTELNINVRRSNYELYGDISNRLMQILKKNCEELEIYSIDEAFATITRSKEKKLYKWGAELRSLVYQNIGIPISIGIGDSKVQAKIANHIAKKIEINSGIFDIGIIENKDDYLNQIKVSKIWGIGKQMSTWLKARAITNARELRDMSSQLIKEKYGVVGLRLQYELKGKSCIPLREKPSDRKEICVSRSFSYPIDSLEELRQAISKYSLIASVKLRKYNQLASAITIFTNTNYYSEDIFKSKATAILDIPSSDSRIIIRTSLELTKRIFKPYKKLTKAGIIMHKLQKNNYQQKLIFESRDIQENQPKDRLNTIIDNVNQKYGRDTLNFTSSIIENDWVQRRNRISGFKTTNIESIPTVFAN
tara:strand:+ start:517 stop:1794 length:1278 start_codon:yes stop_codon:yes gene_type:complete